MSIYINDNLQQQAELRYHERFETADRSNRLVGVLYGSAMWLLSQKRVLIRLKNRKCYLSITVFRPLMKHIFQYLVVTAIKSNKFVVDNTCFMISKLNPTTKRVWKPYCLTENAVCSTEFIVYKANRQETRFPIFGHRSSSFSFYCSHVRSTGSRQRTRPSDNCI